jgi:hypothetical protein
MLPPNEEVAQRLRKATGGVEQTVNGFFQMWSVFMFNSPLPDAGDEYRLEDLGERYRVTYKAGLADVVATMTRNYLIDEVRLTTPSAEITIHPHFSVVKKRYVLIGFEGTVKVSSNDLAEKMRIEYQDVDDLELPHLVHMEMTLPKGTIEFPIAFDRYDVTTR